MTRAFGKTCTPRMPGGGAGFRYVVHFVSALPNATPNHEFEGLRTSASFDSRTSPLMVLGGRIEVPTGPGFGIDRDPSFVVEQRVVAA